jgi:nitrate/nitrite transporter NarK
MQHFSEVSMTTSSLGLIAGLLLGIAAAAGGLTGFVVALILGVAGYLIGGQRDGEFDLSALFPGSRRG